MASVYCPGCRKKYAVPSGYGGRTVPCKACGSAIVIPSDAPPAQPMPAIPVADIASAFDEGTSPVSAPSHLDLAPPPLPPRQVRPTTAPPPPYRSPYQPPPAGFSIGFQFKPWKLLPIFIALILLGVGVNEWSISSNSTAIPQSITCQTLETTGCGSNHHVRVTDFYALKWYVSMNKNSASPYQLVALVGKNDVAPAKNGMRMSVMQDQPISSSSIHVLLKTTDIRQPADFMKVLNRPSIDGMVGGTFDTVPPAAVDILKEHYPGIDTSKCYIVEEGRMPRSGLAVSLLAGGFLVLLLAIGLLFLKYE